MSRQDKSTTERHAKTLRELVKRSENKVCADCKRNDPRWASWNIGVFLCIRCSGIHRGMGTHISKVKSVDLDMWTPEQMEAIQKWGNRRANLYWEAHLKPGHVPPEHKMESFIRSKYESRRWAMEGPPPIDPSILENSSERETLSQQPHQEQPTAAAPVKPTHVSSHSTTSRSTTLTTQQPQVHRLLSANFAKPPTSSTQTPVAAQPVQPPAPQDDIFSLDFHAPPVSTSDPASQQPKKDVKQDILSLFSTPAANTIPNQFGSNLWNAQQPNPPQSTQPTSMVGTTGVGAWGTSSGWTPAPVVPPAQANVWSAPPNANMTPQQTPNLFNTNAIWGGTLSPTSSSAPAKKDDAFSDIWGSFK